MADRRMISKRIVESARFLKMPSSSQNLYFHLCLNADDDGVVEAYPVMNLIKASEDDLRILYSKKFIVILNEDLVSYIMDWRESNKIRADRKKDSIYKELLVQVLPDLELLEAKTRSDVGKKSGPSTDGAWTAQCSVVQDSIGQDSIGECSDEEQHTDIVKCKLDQEILTVKEYMELVSSYSAPIVDGVIHRILTKPYHGCLNRKRISDWCAEHTHENRAISTPVITSKHAERMTDLIQERR